MTLEIEEMKVVVKHRGGELSKKEAEALLRLAQQSVETEEISSPHKFSVILERMTAYGSAEMKINPAASAEDIQKDWAEQLNRRVRQGIDLADFNQRRFNARPAWSERDYKEGHAGTRYPSS